MHSRKKEGSSSSFTESEKKDDKTVSAAEIDRLVGTPGSFVFMTTLPLVLQYAWYSCSKFQCDDISTLKYLASVGSPVAILKDMFPFPSKTAIYIFLGWTAIQWLLHFIVPGKNFLGFKIAWKGMQLNYKMNGLATTLISILAGAFLVRAGYFDTKLIVDHYGEIIVVANIFAYSVSIWLYIKGILFKEGNPSGNIVLDFFYGYEPNPRIFWNHRNRCQIFL